MGNNPANFNDPTGGSIGHQQYGQGAQSQQTGGQGGGGNDDGFLAGLFNLLKRKGKPQCPSFDSPGSSRKGKGKGKGKGTQQSSNPNSGEVGGEGSGETKSDNPTSSGNGEYTNGSQRHNDDASPTTGLTGATGSSGNPWNIPVIEGDLPGPCTDCDSESKKAFGITPKMQDALDGKLPNPGLEPLYPVENIIIGVKLRILGLAIRGFNIGRDLFSYFRTQKKIRQKDVVGWGEHQTPEGIQKTINATRNLTSKKLKSMIRKGLSREWVEKQKSLYEKALKDPNKAGKNRQLPVRLDYMNEILKLWNQLKK